MRIAEHDLREAKGRLYFRNALFPWQIHEFDGKYPALDALVHAFADEGVDARALPEMFLVQHKSQETAPATNAGEVMVKHFEVEHTRHWLQFRDRSLQVMLTLYREQTGDMLYRWVDAALRTQLGERQDGEVAIAFQESHKIEKNARSDILKWIEEQRHLAKGAGDQAPLSEVPPPPIATEFVLEPRTPGMVYYCNTGLRSTVDWSRFGFETNLNGKSALIVSAFEEEHVGINLPIRENAGRAEIIYRVLSSTGSNITFDAIVVPESSISERRQGREILRKARGDDWRSAVIKFDFTKVSPTPNSVVLAPRINEDAKEKGPGVLAIHSIKVFPKSSTGK